MDENSDGYLWPEWLVIEGFAEWDKTGRRPNPIELARRLVPSFNDDMDNFKRVVDKQRPKQEG